MLKDIHTDVLKNIRSGEYTDLLKNIQTFGGNNRRAEEHAHLLENIQTHCRTCRHSGTTDLPKDYVHSGEHTNLLEDIEIRFSHHNTFCYV
jgi:hypothetical protein